MIFLTVGNRYGFDRLVRAVDELVGRGAVDGPVVAQIGEGAYAPRHCEHARYYEAEDYERMAREAQALIGHAGSGTIATALALDKPLLVLPRRARYREHVNDHQVATARRFAALGSIVAVESIEDLADGVASLRSFVPQCRTPNVEGLVDRIGDFLSDHA